MMQKLKQSKAETLVEALVSLLIIVLSVAMISTCILTATMINRTTKEADESYRLQLQQAEGRMGTPTQAEIVIQFQAGETKRIEVDVYGKEDGAFISYDYSTEVEP